MEKYFYGSDMIRQSKYSILSRATAQFFYVLMHFITNDIRNELCCLCEHTTSRKIFPAFVLYSNLEVDPLPQTNPDFKSNT